MKEQIKAPEKIQLTNEEIVNLSDAQFKTLLIRILTELVEYGLKIEEKVKAMQSETKKNIQGTGSEGKETGTQINDMEQKEEINIHPTGIGAETGRRGGEDLSKAAAGGPG